MLFLLFLIGNSGAVVIDSYPDPFAATSSATIDPFAATSRLKGS